jgi:hypothetical protein
MDEGAIVEGPFDAQLLNEEKKKAPLHFHTEGLTQIENEVP